MGDNKSGQLGISQPGLDFKIAPVLVDSLINIKLTGVSCGAYHTLVCTEGG